MVSVSLDPSQPILILNIQRISFTLCLFSFIYSYAFTLYFLSPSSQNSFSVGNSLSIYVRTRAPLTISQLMFVLTIFCHYEYWLLQCSLIMSKSVTFIYSRSFRQYLTVFVYRRIAFLVILLWRVPSSNIILPIMFRVFLLLSCDIFLIPSSISVASLAPYMGDLRIARIARRLEILYFS